MAAKKTTKYVLYQNKLSSIDGIIINSGTVNKSRTWLIDHLNKGGLYGIKERGGLKYDGWCGLYIIYKTKPDKKGIYNVLHIER